ncbi:MAG: RNA methyltransferase [Rhizobiaceae bacterium]|nr:RNA methyltransferase [Rhizobiaceae bacterium]
MNDILKIEMLGHRGDGVANTSKGRVFVPFALGGERVEVRGNSTRRELIGVLDPSPDRAAPICEYFGTCGGCQLQHFAKEPYLEWKQDLVDEALAGLDIEVRSEPIVSFENAKRRRVVFTACHTSDGVALGFLKRGTNDIVGLGKCPIIKEGISNSIETIKQIIRPILPAKGNSSIHVLECKNGLDIQVESEGKLNEGGRQSAVRLALEAKISRLSFGDETLVETKRPNLTVGLAWVSPPPGIFVQAMREAELHISELVCAHLKGCKKVADLYCGIGTFALRLAENSMVLACESEQSALDALDEAWRGTGGRLKSITCEKRDLFIRPVMALELKKIQGVVFDPPRAGALPQARQLALSKVRKIAAVSCNPNSLAQDLECLIEGGFRVVSITPIDQFVHTPHVEVVVLLER